MLKSLSEIKGDKALDFVADMLDPVTAILADVDVKTAYEAGSYMSAIKVALKNHKKEVKIILALMDEEDPKTYEPNALTAPARLYQIVTDKDVQDLFTLQGQKSVENTSGSVLENTEDEKK